MTPAAPPAEDDSKRYPFAQDLDGAWHRRPPGDTWTAGDEPQCRTACGMAIHSVHVSEYEPEADAPAGATLCECVAAPPAGGPQEAATPEERYRNGLLWIRHIAGLHYFGAAFDPEHMRDLANVAANLLDGKDLPDYGERMAAAQERAREMAERFGKEFAE